MREADGHRLRVGDAGVRGRLVRDADALARRVRRACVGTCHVWAALWAASCATGVMPPIEERSWVEAHNGRVAVLSDLGPETTERLARGLAWFHQVIEVESGHGAEQIGPEPLIVVTGDRTTFESFAGDHDISAFFANGRYGRYIVVDGSQRAALTYELLCHEYVHLVLASEPSRRYPTWYHEGLAMLLSQLSRTDRGIEIGGNSRFNFRSFGAERSVRFDLLLAAGLGEPSYRDNRDFENHHESGWALTHYFLLGDGDREQLDRYLELWDAGVPVGDAVREAFGLELSQLETNVQSYTSTRVEVHERPLRHYRARGAVQSRTLSRGEALERLGELALELRRGKLASHLLRTAIQDRPESGVTYAQLAWLLTLRGELEAAQTELDHGLVAEPGSAEVQSRAGDYWLEIHKRLDVVEGIARADDPFPPIARARAHYRTALDLDPDLAPALRGLGLTYVSARDGLRPGIEALERARRTLKRDAEVLLGLAILYELASRDDDAERMLLRLQLDLPPGEYWDDVERRIRVILRKRAERGGR